MYRPPAYAIGDVSLLHDVMRRRSFATVAAIIEGRVQFAYAPVVVDAEPPPFGAIRFHLAFGNPFARLDGIQVRMSFLRADAYVSPDWYQTQGAVPTWNYIAVEGAGRAQLLKDQELRQLLTDLSAQHEERLRPKEPWTLDKISDDRVTTLLKAIRGFVVKLETLEGKFKLSQDKTAADIARVMAGLEARGDAASLAVARAMKERWSAGMRASTSSA